MATDVLSPRTNLTPKQDAFARFLFQGLSQRDAYLKAGYSSNQLPDTIDRAAWTLASSHKIHSRLQELQAKAESDTVMTVQERKARLSEVGRANLTDFVDSEGNIVLKPSAALAEFVVEEQVVDQETALSRRTKRLKLRDPIAAIDSLNKMERIGADNTPSLAPGSQVLNIIVVGGSDNLKDILAQVKERTQQLQMGE